MADEAQATEDGYGKRPMWQWVVIYLIIAAVLYGAIYYLFLSKKGSYESNVPTSTESTTPEANPTAEVMTNEMVVTLASVSSSTESGTAVLKEENGKVTVLISLTGFVNGVSQPAHIHEGVCPGVGTVKYPLQSAVNGTSTTVLDVALAQLKQELPLAINVHESEKNVKNYVSCGPLLAQ